MSGIIAGTASEHPFLPRSLGLAHVVRHADGTYVGVWGNHLLRTAFQPIYAFWEGQLVPIAFEGLLRPMRGNVAVSPGVFFGHIPPIDRMHVETLSRTLHLLNAGLFLDPSVGIFVNFDPSLFVDRALTEAALRDTRLVLHEAGLDPRRVVCEVTERRALSEASVFGFVETLREHGFRIAVDDYGAEDSDMRRIEMLKPDIVKFDSHWIGSLMNSGPGYALLAKMVETFSAQDIITIFEGLEESWQVELAERCGVPMVQGYAVGRPALAPTVIPHGESAKAAAVVEPSSRHRHPPRPPAASAPSFGRRIARF